MIENFYLGSEYLRALKETFWMISIGVSFAIFFGSGLGTWLYLLRRKNSQRAKWLASVIGSAINIIRSFPFVILMIAVIPLTRKIVGSSIGPFAATVPLAIAATAYCARLVEMALNDVPTGVIEAAESMGTPTWRIVWNVLFVEARGSLILAFTTLTISYLSYSAAAGVVGGGGIGDLAIRYGYYRFQTDVMIFTVAGLILFVQGVQFFGQWLSRKLTY